MGNINNLWFLKDSGGDWASTKCELDDCYSIPFDREQDDSLYLQVDLPTDTWTDKIWLTTNAGSQIQDIMPLTDWKLITGDGWNRLIFRVPQDSYICQKYPTGEMEKICIASLYSGVTSAYHLTLLDNYVAGLFNTEVHIFYNGALFNIDTDPLPPGFVRLDQVTFQVPCDINSANTYWQVYSTAGNGTHSWPSDITTRFESVYGAPLKCFHFEIPLIPTDTQQQVGIMSSEPFHCTECQQTLKISSDYCGAKTDIFDEFIFDTAGLGTTHYGGLISAKNDLRIQAVLKKTPSKLEHAINERCNNFRSTIQQRYKLQGSFPTDYPNYMVNVIESIFSGKKIYIEGEEYIPQGEAIFQERNVSGRSMKKLEVELTKCTKAIVYDCSCEPQTCEDNPLLYSGGMLLIPAPNAGYGVDRSIWFAQIFPSFISGGAPPYTIDNWTWQVGGQSIAPDNTYQPFDQQNPINFFKRGPGFEACAGCLSITCKIYDSRGCYVTAGVSVDVDDLRCVGNDGSFQLISTTSNSITIGDIQPYGYDFDFSYDSINFFPSGQISGPGNFTINGLWAGNFHVMVRLRCNCVGMNCEHGYVGPIHVLLV